MLRFDLPRNLRTGLLLILLLSLGATALASDLRSIDDVPSIETYRVRAKFQVGDTPPVQLIEVDGAYGKDPERQDLRIVVTEHGRDPVTFLTCRVNGQLYVNSMAKWANVEKFHADELIALSPDQLLGVAAICDDLGTDRQNGREVRHLRGDKDDLLTLDFDKDAFDVARMERADIELWVDVKERFIVKFHLVGEVGMRGDPIPVDMTYAYLHFNEPVTVEPPLVAEIPATAAPPALGQADVDRKLGFVFALPESAQVYIAGATVSILTSMLLTEARRYAQDSMRAAGFEPATEVERAPGEFYTDYTRGKRKLGVLVFQVTERGATIQVGALK